MITKYSAETLIKEFSPLVIEKLKLSKFAIRWHVYNSNTKSAKDLNIAKGCVAQTLFTTNLSKKFHIVVYFNLHRNLKELKGTIIHELLHVKMRSISALVSEIEVISAHSAEEKIVQDIENLILALM